MIKNWMTRQQKKFQDWLDRPSVENRQIRQRELLSPERERPWQTEPVNTTPWRPDPIKTLPRTPLRDTRTKIAVIKGQGVAVSESVLEMLKEMDQMFIRNMQEKIDWLEVRTARRQARNAEVAARQGAQMFDGRADDINEMTEEEALAFVQAQAQAILARAKHASDPNTADTTTFAAVMA